MIGGSDGRIAIRGLRQSELHVRLAGDQPHLADQHVLNLNGVRPRNGQGLRLGAGAQAKKFDTPFAVGTGGGLFDLAGESDGYYLAGIRRSPDRYSGIAFEHHAVAQDVRNRDPRPCSGRYKGDRGAAAGDPRDPSNHFCPSACVNFSNQAATSASRAARSGLFAATRLASAYCRLKSPRSILEPTRMKIGNCSRSAPTVLPSPPPYLFSRSPPSPHSAPPPTPPRP